MSDRVFTADDLWRIYCNNLTDSEMLKFRRAFISSNGDCEDGENPCGEIQEDVKSGRKDVKGFVQTSQAFLEVSEELADGLSFAFNSVVEFVDSVKTGLDEYNAIKREEFEGRIDSKLAESVPNPIERAEIVAETMQSIDAAVSSAGGGFVKSASLGQALIKNKFVWELKEKVVKKSKIELDKVIELALAAVELIDKVAEVIEDDC